MTPEEQRELDELNRQTRILGERRKEILDQAKERRMEDILSLDWLRDESICLNFSTYHGAAAGLPIYTLTGAPRPPILNDIEDSITLSCNSNSYEENILLRPRWDGFLGNNNSFKIITNNHDLLADFIKRLGRRLTTSSDFNKKLKVYKVVDQYRME